MILSILLAVNCVSAAEGEQADQFSTSDETGIDEALTADADPGTFTDLNNEISTATDNTIELDKDYKHNDSVDSNFNRTTGIQITKNNLVIDGKGHAINGNSKAPIFNITANNTVFKNIGFINGYANLYGGGIRFTNCENITIINCTFTNNHASSGGALYFLNCANIEIVNSTFNKNDAGTNGGAIYLDNCEDNRIMNSNFTNNTAKNLAGGIYVNNYTIIENSIFTQNSVGNGVLSNGGGIHIANGKIKNSTFIKNSVKGRGGAVFISSGTIENSTFIQNNAKEGGAIGGYADLITTSMFVNNTASQAASAFSGSGKITNSIFKQYLTSNLESINMSSGIISNCTLINKGVVHYSYKPINLTIENSLFLNANIVNVQDGLTLSNNIMKDGYVKNDAKIESPVYFMVPNYAQTPEDTEILAKMFDDNGNTILSRMVVQSYFNFTVENANHENETVVPSEYTQINGIWYFKTTHDLDEGNYTVHINLTDRDNFENYFSKCTITSGLLQVYDYGNFESLENFISTSSETTITLTKDYINSILTETRYINGINIDRDNIVIDGAGHAISGATVARIFNITGKNVVLKNIRFTDGFGDCGGAVYACDNLTIVNCTFEDNRANRGGAAYLVNGAVINSTFTSNYATKDGGAVYIEREGAIENSTFSSNFAENGGGVFIKNQGSILNSTFNLNTAENGGAGYFDEDVNIVNSSFISNSAEKGGSTYFKKTGTLLNSTLDSNDAYHGGAIFNEGTLSIENSTFKDNSAADGSNNIALVDNGRIITKNVTPEDLSAEYAVDLSAMIVPKSQYYNTIYYRDNVTIDANITSNGKPLNTGNVIINIDNKDYIAPVINGAARIVLSDLRGGNHSYVLRYDGGKQYSKPSVLLEFTIDPLRTQINPTSGNFVINNDERYIASLNIYFNGPGIPGEEIKFYINDVLYGTSITNRDGVGVLDLTAEMLRVLQAGTKTLYIVYDGNENFTSTVSQAVYIVINKGNAEIIANDTVFDINQDGHYSILVQDSNGKAVCRENVTFTFNGNSWTVPTDDMGIAQVVLPKEILENAGYGETPLTIRLNDTNYNGGNKRVTITIEKGTAEISASPSNYIRNIGGEYSATVKDISGNNVINQLVTFTLDGIDIGSTLTDSEGIATISIVPSILESIGYGVKDLLITLDETNYNPASKTVKISINDENAAIAADNANFNVEGDRSYSIAVNDSNGVPVIGEEVVFTLNGEVIGTAVTDENGIATIILPPTAGSSDISIKINDDKYAAEPKNATIVIEKTNTAITATASSYVINYGGTYSITLKDANNNALGGKQITFILNGKNIGSTVTNANGVASIKLTAGILKAAKAGSRNLVVKFNSDATYNAASKTVKVSIKKEKTKITAKKKTFKRAVKVKKYTITLKNSKKKAVKKAKVTLKIKGKTYKAKTNSKGKATFKIKKLTKKGTYKAKIAFKATAYYLKSSKKVKIKIK